MITYAQQEKSNCRESCQVRWGPQLWPMIYYWSAATFANRKPLSVESCGYTEMDENKNWITFLLRLAHILSIHLWKPVTFDWVWMHVWVLFGDRLFSLLYFSVLSFQMCFAGRRVCGYCSQTMSSDNAQQRGHSAGVSLPLLLRTGNVVLLLSRVTLGVLLLPQTFARYIRQALYHPPPLCGCALLLLELDLSSINQLNLPREKKSSTLLLFLFNIWKCTVKIHYKDNFYSLLLFSFSYAYVMLYPYVAVFLYLPEEGMTLESSDLSLSKQTMKEGQKLWLFSLPRTSINRIIFTCADISLEICYDTRSVMSVLWMKERLCFLTVTFLYHLSCCFLYL